MYIYINLHCQQCARKLVGEGLRQYERGDKHMTPHYLCPFCGYYPLKNRGKENAASTCA